ncbi:DUF4199 domain-containing protein [Hymenobacter sp. BT175]|uniref:DUF4199 domain-containing protein n=1 Tax=Hymenobacter translucens TaxID=2886507 RepID=UPI001D0E2573|nr:DUF4199 domain-containing protein [Hymenobacter translucens]MCC2546812.1 DUF4199 domain-containing protein [Hymenobacter translucens]
MTSDASRNHPVLRTAFVFGLGAGILSLLWLIGLYLGGQNPYGPKRLMSMLVVPVAVVGSQWFLRRYFQPNGPGLGRAMGTGVLTALVLASLSALGVYGFAKTTGPELMEKNRVEMRRVMEASRKDFVKKPGDAERFEKLKDDLASTPEPLATDEFTKKLILGLLLSIPGGIFFRK